jgi:glycosyltransferase involved in cell wall biosynthesis
VSTDYWGNARLNNFSLNQRHQLDGVRILFGVGSLSISGGTNLILNYASTLQDLGAQVSVGFIVGDKADSTWHPKSQTLDIRPLDEFSINFYDLGIATWWRTVEPILGINCAKILYFVQSLESRFALNYEDQDEKFLAAATYMINLPSVTVASWLHNLIQTQTPSKAWLIQNGIDKRLFPLKKRENTLYGSKLRVLVEGHLKVPMKGVERTLEHLSSIDDIEVWHINPMPNQSSSLTHKTFNAVALNKMHEIYSQVDVLVKMSRVEGMYGPPLEAFHAGVTAVTSKVTGYDEYAIDHVNALLVDIDDFESMKTCVMELRDNSNLLSNLKNGALETARNWPSVDESASSFASLCYLILTSPSLGRINKLAAIDALKELAVSRNIPLALIGE